jgi:hypothetical protein
MAMVGDRQGGGAPIAQVAEADALFGGQHRGAEGAQHVVVGRRAGVAAGPEPIHDFEGGEGAQPIFGGIQVVEGQLGELVAGEHAVVGQEPAQLPITWGEPGGQGDQPAGLPVGASLFGTTSGCGHLHRACESATCGLAQESP